MKVLLVGSNGMLGQAIYSCFKKHDVNILCVARRDADHCFDLTDDQALEKCIHDVAPDVVINTAAIVDLELCERDPGGAYMINGRIPGMLAKICKRYGGYLIQVSSDHYYCGNGDLKHDETAPVELVNEYARSKYVGEQLALTYEDALVIRTNIVGFRGAGKPTFIEWAIKEIKSGYPMELFNDFFTSSMHTTDFARILLDVLIKHPIGIYNLASSEVNNKKDFITGLASSLYGKELICKEASVKDIQGVPRANSLGLDTSKIEGLLGYRMPDLGETLKSIRNEFIERKRNDVL